jgi:hypothetical protein
VADCESKAEKARTEETRRAWLIAARDWKKMAEREELKYLDTSASTLIPNGNNVELEDAIRRLAAKSVSE